MISSWLLAATMRPGVRYTGWRWRLLARRIRRRDGNRCRQCRRDDQALHVHHKRGVARGGSYWPTNLITLCAGCHERQHGRDLDGDGAVG